MNKLKLRKFLIHVHLYLAAFLAPAFALVAISGGLYLIGNKGSFESTPVSIAIVDTLDFKSATLQDDLTALIATVDAGYSFDYVKDRGSVLQTRPTSRTFYEFRKTDAGVTVVKKDPNIQASLMELHKGHGPTLYKTYQKVSAIALLLIIFGGVLMGLLVPTLRRKTIIASALGAGVFIWIAFFA